MKHTYLLIGLATAALTLSACNKTSTPTEVKETVATVNGKPVTAAEFDAFATAAARKPAADLAPDQKSQLLDQYIGMQLAAELAQKNGLDKKPEVASQLSLVRLNVLADAALKKQMDENAITDQEIKAEYDSQIAAMGRQYHARHILVESKAVAESIIQQLNAGTDFAKLATKESSDGSAKQGGDLGWFSLSSMVPAFGQALSALDKGKYTTTPVQTQYGYHVIKLEDFRTPTPPEFEQVKDQVKTLVQRKKVQNYLEELRKTAKIEKTLPTEKKEVASAPAAAATETTKK